MRARSQLVSGLIIAVTLACSGPTTPPADVAAFGSHQPATLQQIDRVSLLAWKETLGPRYPLTISRRDSIDAIIDFFSTSSSEWTESATLTGVPMVAGFYRGDELESQRGFIEFSHGAGGLLVIQERGQAYSRPATAAEIAKFLSFFGVGVVLVPN